MAVFGPLWGMMSGLYGRRSMLRIMSLLGIAANIATALSPSFGLLVLFRLLTADTFSRRS